LTGEQVERRLAAVLAADVAGYSRLMGADEEDTLARLKVARKIIVDPTIAAHRGRIVKTTGDGLLVEFASAVDAVRCGTEVQRGMAAQNADVPQDVRIQFRIGIHVGDIIIDDNDIFGDGVNIAARIENECEPGGVYLSDDAFRQVRNKVSIEFDDLGERTLKNIERPVRIYAASGKATVVPSTAASSNAGAAHSLPQALALPKKPSIVVLPLQNMSGDPEQEYFADGLTENLTTDLSRIGDLFVIGRNTAFTYKGKKIDLKQIGRELGVRYALEGSVQRGGDRIRVNVQLIDTATGGHLWAERFDRDRGDIFMMQDEISRRTAYILTKHVTTAELARRERDTSNSDADDFVLRARHPKLWGSTPENYAARINLCEQAARLDSQNVDAWSGIAANTAVRLFLGWSPARSNDLSSAAAALQKAMEINPNDHYVVFAKGHVAFARRDYAEALEAYVYATELNPSRAVSHQLAGMAKIALGSAEEAFEPLQEAIRLSPHDLHSADLVFCTGWAYWELERYPEALHSLERAKAQNSRLTWANAHLASTYIRLDQQQKAEAAIRDALQYQSNWTTKVVEESYPLRPASLAALVGDLRKAGLPDQSPSV
jgi:adenylate cyclase